MGMKKTLCSKEILMVYYLYICISLYPCLMCLHSVAPSKISSCLGLHRVFFVHVVPVAKAVPTKLKIIPLEWAHQHQGIMVRLGVWELDGFWVSQEWKLDETGVWMFPNHPCLIGFSIINHPFWGTPIFGNTHIKARVLWVYTPED